MIEIGLFLLFVIFPFFRVFNGELLSNTHNIIAIAGLGGVILGIIFNKLDKYLNYLIRYLLPIVISTIAVDFFLKTYDSAQIKITLLEIGGPLILILWIIKRINIGNFKIQPSRKYAFYPAAAFMLSGIISFALSQFKLETFEPGFLRRISYLGVFIVTVFEFNREEDFYRIVNWVLASLLVVVVYGLFQYFGVDWHIWKGAFGRNVFSTFGNPNFYAAWLVLVLPLVGAKFMITRKWYYVPLGLAVIFSIYATSTKGSWLGLAVAISVFVVLATLYLIEGDTKKLKKIALGIVIGVVIFAAGGITWFSIKRVDSIRFRLFTWGATMKMVSEPVFVSPLKSVSFGHGIESFKLVYPAYRRPEIFHIEGKHNTETDHAHNEFMEVFFDEGIVGLTVFIWLLISIYYTAIKRLNSLGIGVESSKHKIYLVGLISGTVGMLAHASVSVHVRFVSSGYILWTFLGFIVVHTAPIRKEERKENEREKYLSGLKFILIMILLGAGAYNSFTASRRFLANIYHNKAIAYSKQRSWNNALHYYDLVQRYHPSFVMAYYFEGNVYNDRLSEALNNKNKEKAIKNYELALKAYKKVRTMYPHYVQIYFQEGIMHLKVGNVKDAEKSFRKYLNIVDPVYPYTYFRMGMIKARQGKAEQAQWYLQEPPRRKPNVIEGYLNLANVYLMQKKYKKAEDTFFTGLEKNKNNKRLLTALGNLYERLDKNQKAIQTYERLLKEYPESKNIRKKLEQLKS
ncbi:MAG: O-antigen ligase family protein [Atribacterota bacterium]